MPLVDHATLMNGRHVSGQPPRGIMLTLFVYTFRLLAILVTTLVVVVRFITILLTVSFRIVKGFKRRT